MLKGPKIVSPMPGPKAQKIIDLHQQVIMTTTMVPYPIVGSEAQGALVKDVDGNVYIDFSSAVAVANVGHNHPEVVKAVKETEEISVEAFKKGLILLPVGTNCIRIAPPLNISQELLDKGLDILFDAIKAVESG